MSYELWVLRQTLEGFLAAIGLGPETTWHRWTITAGTILVLHVGVSLALAAWTPLVLQVVWALWMVLAGALHGWRVPRTGGTA